jgi:excisionase family DNA binding protein
MQGNYSVQKRIGYESHLAPVIEQVDDETVLTPEDVADHLGLSVRQVRRYCESGKMPSYCFGRKYVIYGSDFKEFMKRSKVTPYQNKETLH